MTAPIIVMTIPTVSPLFNLSPKKIKPNMREKRVWDFIRKEARGGPIVHMETIQNAAPIEVTSEL